MPNYTPNRPDIMDIINDPAASSWLKRAAREGMNRDPIDAANDAAVLYRFLDRRAKQIHATVSATLDTLLSTKQTCPKCSHHDTPHMESGTAECVVCFAALPEQLPTTIGNPNYVDEMDRPIPTVMPDGSVKTLQPTGCREKVCHCHVDPHPPGFSCSHCGCSFPELPPAGLIGLPEIV